MTIQPSVASAAPLPTPTAEKWITQTQINAALRYGGTWVATGGTALAVLGLIPADKAHALVDAMQGVLSDVQSLVGHLYLIAGIVGPLVMAVIARFGVKSASPQAQIATVQAMPEAQVTVTDARLAVGAPAVQVTPAKP
jgi:hypothetical protein